jgi:hypothetical protein
MEQQNKYFTPDISELHVGYEYYTEWKDGTLRKIIIDEYIDRNGDGDLPQAFWGLSNGICGGSSVHPVMTKYLDREDIESLGWENYRKLTDWSGKNDKPNQVAFDMQNMMAAYDYDSHILAITVKDPTRSNDGKTEVYDYPKNARWFRGECKSINELRMIMKMLKIQ